MSSKEKSSSKKKEKELTSKVDREFDDNMPGGAITAKMKTNIAASVEEAEKKLRTILSIEYLEKGFHTSDDSPTQFAIPSHVDTHKVIDTFQSIRSAFAEAREQGYLDDHESSDWINKFFAPFIDKELMKFSKRLGKGHMTAEVMSADISSDSNGRTKTAKSRSSAPRNGASRKAAYDPRRTMGLPYQEHAAFQTGETTKVHERKVRVLLILLLNPINELFKEDLLGELARAINLSGIHNLQLLSYWGGTEVTANQYIDIIIKPFVSALDRFIARRHWDEGCVHMAILLNTLHYGWKENPEIHEYFIKNRRQGDSRLSPFHLSKMSLWRKEDLQKEYLRWQIPQTEEDLAIISVFHFGFLLDAPTKLRIVETHNYNCVVEEARLSGRNFLGFVTIQPFTIKVRRSHIVRDTVVALAKAPKKKFAAPLRITFEGEAGIDAGGVRTEFFQLLSAQIFGPENPMFKRHPITRRLWYGDVSDIKEAILYAQEVQRASKSDEAKENPSSKSKSRKSGKKSWFSSSSKEFPNSEPMDMSLNAFMEATFNDNYEHTLMSQKSEKINAVAKFEDEVTLRLLPGYRLAGQIMGLAMYNNNRIDALFPGVFFQQLLNREPDYGIKDIEGVDPELAKQLRTTLDYTAESDFESLDMYFELNGVDLIPDGSNQKVTLNNKEAYVNACIRHILKDRVEERAKALRDGFAGIVNVEAPAIQLLSDEDVELALVGTPDFDFKAFRKATKYVNGYHMDHKFIKYFWDVLENEFTRKEQEDFLAFATGSPRAPVGGLGNLTLVIKRYGGDSNRLPIASTCFFTLHLPEYSSKEKLISKLRTAIAHKDAFGLG